MKRCEDLKVNVCFFPFATICLLWCPIMLCFVQLTCLVSYFTLLPQKRLLLSSASAAWLPSSSLSRVFTLDTQKCFIICSLASDIWPWTAGFVWKNSSPASFTQSHHMVSLCMWDSQHFLPLWHLQLRHTSHPARRARLEHVPTPFRCLCDSCNRSLNATNDQSHTKPEPSKSRVFYNVTQSTTTTHKKINDTTVWNKTGWYDIWEADLSTVHSKIFNLQ